MRTSLPDQVSGTEMRRWAGAALTAVETDGAELRRHRTGEMIPLSSEDDTVATIARWLYYDVHLGGAVDDEGEPASLVHPVWSALLQSTQQRYESRGWTFKPSGTGDVHAYRDGVGLLIQHDQVGEWVIGEGNLRLYRFRANGLFGWHTFISLQGAPAHADVRLYLPDLAHENLLPALVHELDAMTVAWSGKIAAKADSLRPDRLVLYTDEDSFPPVVEAVRRVRVMSGSSEFRMPGFASEVAPGIFGARNRSGARNSHGTVIAEHLARVLAGRRALDLSTGESTGLTREPGAGI